MINLPSKDLYTDKDVINAVKGGGRALIGGSEITLSEMLGEFKLRSRINDIKENGKPLIFLTDDFPTISTLVNNGADINVEYKGKTKLDLLIEDFRKVGKYKEIEKYVYDLKAKISPESIELLSEVVNNKNTSDDDKYRAGKILKLAKVAPAAEPNKPALKNLKLATKANKKPAMAPSSNVDKMPIEADTDVFSPLLNYRKVDLNNLSNVPEDLKPVIESYLDLMLKGKPSAAEIKNFEDKFNNNALINRQNLNVEIVENVPSLTQQGSIYEVSYSQAQQVNSKYLAASDRYKSLVKDGFLTRAEIATLENNFLNIEVNRESGDGVIARGEISTNVSFNENRGAIEDPSKIIAEYLNKLSDSKLTRAEIADLKKQFGQAISINMQTGDASIYIDDVKTKISFKESIEELGNLKPNEVAAKIIDKSKIAGK